MITEWFLGLVSTVVQFFVDGIPDWEVPSQVVNLDDTINGFTGMLDGSGVWLPWAFMFGCIAVVVGSYVVGLTVKVVRAVLAHVPAFGGAG